MAKNRSEGMQLDATSCDIDEDLIAEYEEDSSGETTQDDEFRSIDINTYVPLKLPKEEIEKMRAQYDVVVIQDFSDEYNMTEEEKSERFEFYDLFKRMSTQKMKYSKLPDFIRAYRESYHCLNAVAKVNGVYKKSKFIKLVMMGKIKVSGLKLPTFVGKNKKHINWELVVQYIRDKKLDPDDLAEKENEARFEITTEDEVELVDRLVYDGRLTEILSEIESDITNDEFAYNDDDLTGKNIAVELPKKDLKRFVKKFPDMVQGIAKHKKSSMASNQMRDYAFQMTSDDFAEIERLDKSRGNSYVGIPEFKGELFNAEDFDRYLYQLEQYERKHTIVEYKDELITLDQYEELSVRDQLDESGWNIRNFYNIKEQEKEEKRRAREMEKKKARIKKKLARMEGKTSSKKINQKKKKHKKSSVKNVMNRAIDSKLLNGEFGDFSDYEKEMERWNED